jgi:hypothetical protein
MKIKWAYLTNAQKEQILHFYSDEFRKNKMSECDLNKRNFPVNIHGNVVFSKDF